MFKFFKSIKDNDKRRPLVTLPSLKPFQLKMHTQKEHKTAINFINVLPTHFLYESALTNFSLITVRLCDFLAKGYRQKNCT